MPTKPQKATYGQLLVLKAVAIIDEMREKRLERVNGTHESRREEILQRMDDLPGGDVLKKLLLDEDISLEVQSPRQLRNCFGQVSKAPGNDRVSAQIANNGDGVGMARTAYHELRHVLQIADMGQLDEGAGRRLKNVRTGHMISLMMEADAYTAEIVSAIKADKNGKPEYLRDVLNKRDNGPNVDHAKRFLRMNPFDSFKDEGAFARALFTDLMMNSLDNYSTNYFGSYRMQFLVCPTLQEFKDHLDKSGPMKDFTPSEKLGAIYGADFAGGVSVRALTAMFRTQMPQEEQNVLRLIDSTVKKADTMTDAEYEKLRDDILIKTQSIYWKEDHNTHPPGTAYSAASRFLQKAAGAEKPLTVSDFKAALKISPKKPARSY
ncbi:MAG: hypothetical protein PW788_03205 [Micavibrio sp.]|nr:hypothetical protein [Micavibrio sp.]